jgi:ribonucleoside-triphosphate reductase (thioredoxin)
MLPTEYQNYIAISRYARWIEEKNRRETWSETVERYISYMEGRYEKLTNKKLDKKERDRWVDAITTLKVMPSMRALMTAGAALDKDNVAGFNCSYVAIDNVRTFDEIMYILMCGTGVGFSVERQYVDKLPEIAEKFHETETVIKVRDSKIGWAKSYRELIAMLYAGQIPQFDMSLVRPAGAKLKTFGGRASGPDPLRDLFKFSIETFQKASGRKLTSIECHDIVCKIADVVVCGGVRRSALISLSNLSDIRMRDAKTGQWWDNNPQRSYANNSVAYTEKPDIGTFMKEWVSLYDSKSGERGIFNRVASQKMATRSGRREGDFDFGTNPCSEIVLRNKQFCNLSEVVVRPDDTEETLKEKVEIATIFGTLQSTLSDFRYLTKQWKDNTEEERLLGVSLTGIMDHEVLSGNIFNQTVLKEMLINLKEHSIKTNKKWAEMLGVNQATAITCVKPSGTVSQLVDSASGIHPRYSPYYLRTVRADKKDPLCDMMLDKGFYGEDDVMKPNDTKVIYFPMKSPTSSIMRDAKSAIEQLEIWKMYQLHWCEHKPSITVYVKEDEWLQVGAWVYENFDVMSGVSFLPHSEHSYKQAPYQEVDKNTYEEWLAKTPKNINWMDLTNYEKEDTTTSSKELACTAGACEIV